MVRLVAGSVTSVDSAVTPLPVGKGLESGGSGDWRTGC